jgi:DNA repair protein RadC
MRGINAAEHPSVPDSGGGIYTRNALALCALAAGACAIIHSKTKIMANEKLPMVSEIKISYQPKMKISDRPVVKNSTESYPLFLASWDMEVIHLLEHFKIMILDRANRVKGIFLLATGGMSGVVVDPRIVFRLALETFASSIILAHNHPSENLRPSQADIEVTRQLREAGKLLQIAVLDHLIITYDKYYSFADEGIII